MTRRAGPATLMVMTAKSLLLTEFGGSVSADVDAPADAAGPVLGGGLRQLAGRSRRQRR